MKKQSMYETEGGCMYLTKDDLQAISDLLDEKLEEKLEEKLDKKLEEKLEEKLDKKLEEKLDKKLEEKLDKKLEGLKGSVDRLNVKVDRNTRNLKELNLFVKNMEFTTSKKIARLQDGMDTIEEILRMNDLIPR